MLSLGDGNSSWGKALALWKNRYRELYHKRLSFFTGLAPVYHCTTTGRFPVMHGAKSGSQPVPPLPSPSAFMVVVFHGKGKRLKALNTANWERWRWVAKNMEGGWRFLRDGRRTGWEFLLMETRWLCSFRDNATKNCLQHFLWSRSWANNELAPFLKPRSSPSVLKNTQRLCCFLVSIALVLGRIPWQDF